MLYCTWMEFLFYKNFYPKRTLRETFWCGNINIPAPFTTGGEKNKTVRTRRGSAQQGPSSDAGASQMIGYICGYNHFEENGGTVYSTKLKKE